MKTNILGITRPETLVTTVILLIILGLSLLNFAKAQVLARDVQRKNDLKYVASSLLDYLEDMQQFPQSKDGKILACTNSDGSLRGCDWGVDNVESTQGAYIKPLSQDPKEKEQGFKYLYISDTRHFQLYAHLERPDDDEYNPKIVARNLQCGTGICNFGVSSSFDVPLDKSLEEFEKSKVKK
jgi:hypothetical protein